MENVCSGLRNGPFRLADRSPLSRPGTCRSSFVVVFFRTETLFSYTSYDSYVRRIVPLSLSRSLPHDPHVLRRSLFYIAYLLISCLEIFVGAVGFLFYLVALFRLFIACPLLFDLSSFSCVYSMGRDSIFVNLLLGLLILCRDDFVFVSILCFMLWVISSISTQF